MKTAPVVSIERRFTLFVQSDTDTTEYFIWQLFDLLEQLLSR